MTSTPPHSQGWDEEYEVDDFGQLAIQGKLNIWYIGKDMGLKKRVEASRGC